MCPPTKAYAANYRGHARTRRLLFVMERLPAAARAECLRDVLSEAKGAEDVATYKAAAKRLGSGAADEQWLAAAFPFKGAEVTVEGKILVVLLLSACP